MAPFRRVGALGQVAEGRGRGDADGFGWLPLKMTFSRRPDIKFGLKKLVD